MKNAHDIVPTDFDSIELYDIEAFGFGSSPNELSGKTPFVIDARLTAEVCQNVEFVGGSTIWKGSLLGIVKLRNGRTCLIAVSFYGGFFKILDQSGYYQTHGSSREVLDNTMRRALEMQFIPERRVPVKKKGKRNGSNSGEDGGKRRGPV